MSTNRSFVEKVMTQLKIASQHHRNLLAPLGLQLGEGIHVEHLDLDLAIRQEEAGFCLEGNTGKFATILIQFCLRPLFSLHVTPKQLVQLHLKANVQAVGQNPLGKIDRLEFALNR